MKIRSKTIAYATMKKKKTDEGEYQLEEDIQRLEKCSPTLHDLKVIEGKKCNYKLAGKKEQKAYYCDQEQDGLLMEKKFQSIFVIWRSKNTAKLSDKDGNVLTNNTDIFNEVRGFYETLKTKRDIEDCEIMDLIHEIPQLTTNEAKHWKVKLHAFQKVINPEILLRTGDQ